LVSATEFAYLSQEDVVAAGGTDMAAMVDVIERASAAEAVRGAGAVVPAPARAPGGHRSAGCRRLAA
jgi:hypothetical protein